MDWIIVSFSVLLSVLFHTWMHTWISLAFLLFWDLCDRRRKKITQKRAEKSYKFEHHQPKKYRIYVNIWILLRFFAFETRNRTKKFSVCWFVFKNPLLRSHALVRTFQAFSFRFDPGKKRSFLRWIWIGKPKRKKISQFRSDLLH